MASLLGNAFRFGVATAGFQVEGGFNGPGEPRNNWYEWEAEGRVEPSGTALDFWNQYEHHLDRAAALGIDSFRLSLEWARCEPVEGSYDDEAFERYGAILAACRERGMEPLVTLLHFTHPAWLGFDFWSRADSAERFAGWAAEAVRRLSPACSNWVTLNEINILAMETFFLGGFPPGRRFDGPTALKAADLLLSGHVLAYDRIKQIQPDSVVSTNNCNFSIYELDRLLSDLLLGRSRGVDRTELGRHLARCRDGWYASAAAMGVPGPGGSSRRWPNAEKALRRLASQLVNPVQAFGRAIDAVYASVHERTLDVVQLDYYDPETASHLQPPFMPTAGGLWPLPQRPLWDDVPNPDGLSAYCAANAEDGLELWVVENGLCNRVRRGRSFPRRDGWDRPRYLRENLAAVVKSIAAGQPITGYWHWCLADNYEWGSYEPRFGLYGVDRERSIRWSECDSMGKDSAGAYRRLVEGLRAGDDSVLRAGAD
ncbi:MAG: family 1 glycosylhydrolase [Acidimicrobiales bacterium]|jgi:beta-glucosidase/6-phospho-beta-glucosidase/beta-galactosidase